jgi:hypothetical protein
MISRYIVSANLMIFILILKVMNREPPNARQIIEITSINCRDIISKVNRIEIHSVSIHLSVNLSILIQI